jgi:AbrB family looped-hinge helix DNA binding protein
MTEARMTSKGRITVPKEIRLKLGLKAGDRVRFVVAADGIVRLWPAKRDISSLRGILPEQARVATIDEMEEAVRRGAVARFLRHDRD